MGQVTVAAIQILSNCCAPVSVSSASPSRSGMAKRSRTLFPLHDLDPHSVPRSSRPAGAWCVWYLRGISTPINRGASWLWGQGGAGVDASYLCLPHLAHTHSPGDEGNRDEVLALPKEKARRGHFPTAAVRLDLSPSASCAAAFVCWRCASLFLFSPPCTSLARLPTPLGTQRLAAGGCPHCPSVACSARSCSDISASREE